MKNYHLTISEKDKLYNVLTIGYTSEGGFFLQSPTLGNEKYFICKFKGNNQNGQQHIPLNKNSSRQTQYKPKLTHHLDGNAHVSGTGIISGFYKLTGNPKGIHVKSFDLIHRKNDGGPIFTLTIWGLDKFSQGQKKNQIVFSSADIYNADGFWQGKKDAYAFEGFYFPKSSRQKIDLSKGTILFKHKMFGIISLKYIPCPDNSPGFLGIACCQSSQAFMGTTHGFCLSGAPGQMNEAGYWENIAIIYTDSNLLTKGTKNLSITLWKKLLYLAESFIAKFTK